MDLHTLPFTFVQPSEGETVFLGTLTATVKIPSTATYGAVALVEHTLAAGFLGAPPHRHQREDEISYVLEGELTVQLDDQIEAVSAGRYILKPRGIMHTFWNAVCQRSGTSAMTINHLTNWSFVCCARWCYTCPRTHARPTCRQRFA